MIWRNFFFGERQFLVFHTLCVRVNFGILLPRFWRKNSVKSALYFTLNWIDEKKMRSRDCFVFPHWVKVKFTFFHALWILMPRLDRMIMRFHEIFVFRKSRVFFVKSMVISKPRSLDAILSQIESLFWKLLK